MKKFILIIVVGLSLLLGCNQSEAKYSYSDEISIDGERLSRSMAAFDGVGYEPIGVSTSQAAPAFRDMSNIYGETGGGGNPPSQNLGANFPENYERKLVKRASVRIRVENLETSDNTINELLRQYDAYAASSNVEENSRYYSLRVPSQYYDVFLSNMDGLGRLLSRNESTEDVTLRYYDLEGRLATRQELLRTYQSYLGRAANIEEMLAVEAKISELQYDIERTETQLRNLANLIDYATIELSILGPVASAPRPQGITFGERIKQLFGGFGRFLSTVGVGIVGFVIYGIPILLLLILLYWLLFGKVGLARRLWCVIKK